MKIYVIAVGKIKEKYIKETEKVYLKRIKKRRDIEMIEITDEPDGLVSGSKEKEGKRILSRIPKDSHVVLLDINARQVRTSDIAKEIKNRSVVFVIGGSLGFGNNVSNCSEK